LQPSSKGADDIKEGEVTSEDEDQHPINPPLLLFSLPLDSDILLHTPEQTKSRKGYEEFGGCFLEVWEEGEEGECGDESELERGEKGGGADPQGGEAEEEGDQNSLLMHMVSNHKRGEGGEEEYIHI